MAEELNDSGRVAYLEARVGELHTRLGDLRTEHVKAGESWDRQSARLLDDLEHMENENDQLRREVGRLRREVAFEANGADTFSGADAIAEGRPQCAVHPDGETA
jgi:polyhydroxyalkanoate synthesis regulator phasin